VLEALSEAHLPAAAKLLAGEGWTFTPKELGRVLATGPGLSVAAIEEGQLAGMVMVARHTRLAWIGNVAVQPARRGKGVGEAMVREALDRIRAAGCVSTKLCSVPKALGLYQRIGFRAEGAMRTYARIHERPTHRPREAEVLMPEDLPHIAAMDKRAFGADRSSLLGFLAKDYPDTGVVVREDAAIEGFAFLKPGPEGSELGPLVMDRPSPRLAAQLLDACLGFRLEGGAASVECTTSDAHPYLGQLLRERGFQPRDFTTTRMLYGKALHQDWLSLGALAGLEKG
jgi:GNAT superfamily N-acetyltransferase